MEIIHAGGHRFGPDEFVQLMANREAIESSPFDGIILNFGVDRVWTLDPMSFDEVAGAIDAYRQVSLSRVRANFQGIGVGNIDVVDWFDDAAMQIMIDNMGVVSQVVASAGLRGIMFDTQPYHTQRWRYFPNGGRGFQEVEDKVKERGRAMMSKLIEGAPNLHVLLTIGYSDVYRATCVMGEDLPSSRYALLPAFLDGMQEAARQHRSMALLIDGFLPAYSIREPSAFRMMRHLIHYNDEALRRYWIPGLVTYLFPEESPLDEPETGENRWPDEHRKVCADQDLSRLGRDLPVSFGLMLDYDEWKRGGFHTAPGEFDSNFHTPETLGAVLRGAVSNADRYVWIWTGTARWWPLPGDDRPLVPQAYDESVRKVRSDLDLDR